MKCSIKLSQKRFCLSRLTTPKHGSSSAWKVYSKTGNALKAQVTKLGDGYERVDDELLAYLRRCITGIKGPVMQPEIPVFLNDLLSMERPARWN